MYIIIAAIIIATAIIVAAFIIEDRLSHIDKTLDYIDFRLVNMSYNSNSIVGILGEINKNGKSIS